MPNKKISNVNLPDSSLSINKLGPKKQISSTSIDLSNLLDIAPRGEDSVYTNESIGDVEFDDILNVDGFYDGTLTASSDWGLETDILNLQLVMRLMSQTKSQYAYYASLSGH